MVTGQPAQEASFTVRLLDQLEDGTPIDPGDTPFLAHLSVPAAERLTDGGRKVLFERSRDLPGLIVTNLRQLGRVPGNGPLDGALVDEILQRWET